MGPNENRSPSNATMLYSSVILGATGASCAMADGAMIASAVRQLKRRILRSSKKGHHYLFETVGILPVMC